MATNLLLCAYFSIQTHYTKQKSLCQLDNYRSTFPQKKSLQTVAHVNKSHFTCAASLEEVEVAWPPGYQPFLPNVNVGGHDRG